MEGQHLDDVESCSILRPPITFLAHRIHCCTSNNTSFSTAGVVYTGGRYAECIDGRNSFTPLSGQLVFRDGPSTTCIRSLFSGNWASCVAQPNHVEKLKLSFRGFVPETWISVLVMAGLFQTIDVGIDLLDVATVTNGCPPK